jgi:DNA-binding transcriptional regulator LsrR (DeoR family)
VQIRATLRSNERDSMTRAKPAGPAALVLTASVARRYYVDRVSKSDIAAELGLSRFKVARLLDNAHASGLVRIELDYRGEIDLDRSVRLRDAFSLHHSVVIDSPEDDDTLLRANLGRAAAGLLGEITEDGDVLGLAWARSLMAMLASLTWLAPCPVVQLTGALSRPDVDASSIELVREVARISNGEAFYFYAPMILPDAATANAMRKQPEVKQAVGMFPRVTKAVIAVGAWEKGLSTVADAISEREWREMHDLGVRAEMGGIQIDAHGVPVKTSITERMIAIDARQLRAVPEVMAIAYGTAKAPAVRAAIRGGFVTSLVTHAAMADELLGSA